MQFDSWPQEVPNWLFIWWVIVQGDLKSVLIFFLGHGFSILVLAALNQPQEKVILFKAAENEILLIIPALFVGLSQWLP